MPVFLCILLMKGGARSRSSKIRTSWNVPNFERSKVTLKMLCLETFSRGFYFEVICRNFVAANFQLLLGKNHLRMASNCANVHQTSWIYIRIVEEKTDNNWAKNRIGFPFINEMTQFHWTWTLITSALFCYFAICKRRKHIIFYSFLLAFIKMLCLQLRCSYLCTMVLR